MDGVEIYEIPEEEKEAVLRKEYPFEGCPKLDEIRLDLHVQKKFVVRDFLMIRQNRMNLLVSPFYLEGGGTVIDWMLL